MGLVDKIKSGKERLKAKVIASVISNGINKFLGSFEKDNDKLFIVLKPRSNDVDVLVCSSENGKSETLAIFKGEDLSLKLLQALTSTGMDVDGLLNKAEKEAFYGE